MDNNTQLLIANIDNALEQLKSAKLILEGKTNETKTKQLKKPVRKIVNDPTKENTYRIEELVTTGWTTVDSKLTHLTKENAKIKIKSLVDLEGYNPDDLRVVVDGQV
jgi:hypothetical protein|tara:strand:+ start:173 stop:493 length:321 start_codon:yes stop_codon:yes gene_type:complete